MRASMSAGGVVSGANDASAAMDKMGRHAKQAARDMATLKGIAIGAVVAKSARMAADAFVSAGRAVVTYAAGVATAVDNMNDLAQRLGMGVESLQALQMAAKLSGIDDATVALQKLTVAIGQAAESGKTEAFTKLGLDFQALQAMSPVEQFQAVQAAIAALPTPAERAAAAVAIFGRAGVELLPLMNHNLAEIEERMQRLGAVVGADQVEAIGEMNDALDMVRATFDGIIGTVVGNLAPIVESLAQELLGFVESFNVANADAGGIAGVLTDAVLDIADYLAGVFDDAIASFDGFGVTMKQVGEAFKFVVNVFTVIAETLRAAFNKFQIAGNMLAVGLGRFLQGIGSWVSSDLEKFGKELAANAQQQANENTREMYDAMSNAADAGTRAIFGDDASQSAAEGPARRAVRAARERMTPESKAEREAARKAKEAEAKAAREAAVAEAKAAQEATAAEEKAKRDSEAAKRRQDAAANKAAAVDEKIVDKQDEIDRLEAGKAAKLGGKSNEALKANDIRSSEGMAQFIALATGRDDPAIEENRKTNQKLEEIRKELRALQQEKVDILGAAA